MVARVGHLSLREAQGRTGAVTPRVRKTPARRCTITASKWDFAGRNPA